jgi:AcrR family transcriptional regulator
LPGRAQHTSGARPGRLRADAHRNRELLLAAACDAVIEHGADVPLDDIARRAGVGIATLYRRFRDRPALLRQLALDLMGRSAQEASAALTEEPDPFAALARYMHRALDLRIAAAMPVLVGRFEMDEELLEARRASVGPLEQIVERARAAGSLRPDVSAGDVGMLLVRLARPLPGGFPADVHDELAHRHLGVLLDGLRRGSSPAAALPGPAMTLDDLAAVPPPAPGDDPATTPVHHPALPPSRKGSRQ